MVQKINQLATQLVDSLSVWKNIEAIQRIPYHDSIGKDSPLYCLKVDVYLHHSVPGHKERLAHFPATKFMETSLARNKDRFFLDDVSVHVDYKTVEDLDAVLGHLIAPPYLLHQESSYGLFRLLKGIPIQSQSSWLNDAKQKLENLPDEFWESHKQNLSRRLEHHLSDMSVAFFNRDPLHFRMSFSHFLECCSETLFTINKQFLCPPESILVQIKNLDILPPGFFGVFDSLIREESVLDSERRLELAKHLTENILTLNWTN